MPTLRGAVTFSRYRVEAEDRSPTEWKRVLTRGLRAHVFEPLKPGAPEERTAGFVELPDRDATEFPVSSVYEGDFALFTYRIDEVRIPSAVVREQLERWSRVFEREHQRKPGWKEKNDAKMEIRHTLRSRYPLSTKTFDVSWNLASKKLQIWAGSRKAVDEVESAIVQAFSGVKLVPMVPVVLATKLGLNEKALAPTPSLSLPDGRAGKGAAHGEA